MALVPVILCGGAGSRLWPVSREMHPKPFITLNDGQSLLQKTFIRGMELPDVQAILTVTNQEFFFKTEEELQQVNSRGCALSYILEPVGRNTAPAIAAAALIAARYDPDTMMLVLAADHLIQNQAAFKDAVNEAIALADQDKIVTFGITPDAPETSYGYIEATGNKVLRFVEKPDIVTARVYVESGRFLWNSGMFCFKAGVMLQEMRVHCPDILQAVEVSMADAKQVGDAQCLIYTPQTESFGAIRETSIDYAVMEKSSCVAVVPCNIGWSDIGSWGAFGDLLPKDAKGNCTQGEVILHDVTNCHIQSSDRIVGAVGVDNLVVIDTPDAILVAGKERLQDVKHLYTELKNNGHDTYKFHRTVYRPWGSYTVLEEGAGFKIKRIVVKSGASLSLQMHYHRSEHWVVVSGTAKVIVGNEEKILITNQSVYVPAGQSHRLTNPGVIDLVLIEVQTGGYLGEDDIVRFEDNYGRIKIAV